MIAATGAHRLVLAALHQDSFSGAERWDADAIVAQIGLPGVFGLLCGDRAGSACGFVLARVAADESEILTLAVASDRRRGGVGRDLMQAAMTAAHARGASAMFLEVSETNRAAASLYAGLGFAEVARRPRYYADGAAARILRCALPFNGVAATTE